MGVGIKSVGMYRGKNVVNTSKYVEYFKESGAEFKDYVENTLGIKQRYIRDENETTLTMSIAAGKEALKLANLEGGDIDCLILASILPEYNVPPTSAILYAELECNPDGSCYDTNCACAGMIMAMKQAYGLFNLDKNINRLLLIGCDDGYMISNKSDPHSYGMFGDAAVAIVLERVADENRGYIDSMSYVNKALAYRETFPQHGWTKDIDVPQEERGLIWKPAPRTVKGAKVIKKLLETNEMNPIDIKYFCLSQFGVTYTNLMTRILHLPENHIPFLGCRYGYTGNTSPFVSLYEQIKEKSINPGDTILFWTVGVGRQDVAMLVRY